MAVEIVHKKLIKDFMAILLHKRFEKKISLKIWNYQTIEKSKKDSPSLCEMIRTAVTGTKKMKARTVIL